MPKTMKAELVAIAHSRNISIADALREALEEYITARRNDKGFKNDWRSSWKKTARFLTAWETTRCLDERAFHLLPPIAWGNGR